MMVTATTAERPRSFSFPPDSVVGAMGVSLELEMEVKEAPPALIRTDSQKLSAKSRKRSSCPNLTMYVKDPNGQVTGMDVDLSPAIDVETSYIEEKCCFLVPSGFISGKKDGRRSSAEVRNL